MSKQNIIKVGDVFQTSSCGACEVIQYTNANNIVVRFLNTGSEVRVFSGNLRRGNVKDFMAKNIFGVGYFGEGLFNIKSSNPNAPNVRRAYNVWSGMLERCYKEGASELYPSYEGCTVAEEWHNFQNFAKWYLSQQHNDINELDKDLLVRGNKLYSENTCTLLPKVINIALQERRCNSGKYPPGVYYKKKNGNFIAQLAYGDGVQKHLASCSTWQQARSVYVKAKKEQLIALAEKYRDVISIQAYNALRQWEPVE